MQKSRENYMPFYERKNASFPLLVLLEKEAIMLENRFKTRLIKEIEEMFPGCMITHMDPNEIQGAPDLLILYKNKWAALEGKKNAKASHRPNQGYYVDLMDNMSFASFIYPENKDEVLHALFLHFMD
jgi:hypothetical protein